VALDENDDMCPPSSPGRLFARSTMAIAFQRIKERIRLSINKSPGILASLSGGIVLQKGVVTEYGKSLPNLPALSDNFDNKYFARSIPSLSITEVIASSHSVVSIGSESSNMDISFLRCFDFYYAHLTPSLDPVIQYS